MARKQQIVLVSEADFSPVFCGAEVKAVLSSLKCKVLSARPGYNNAATGPRDDMKGGIDQGKIFATSDGKTIQGYYPSQLGLCWMTEDELADALIHDGAPREAAEDIVSQAIAVLERDPYFKTHRMRM